MSRKNWSGPILLASLAVTLFTFCALIVFGLAAGWRDSVLVSGFFLFGMAALSYELGYKVYWRQGRRFVFAVLFALPTAIAALAYLRRLVL